jgi:hypothetical protein
LRALSTDSTSLRIASAGFSDTEPDVSMFGVVLLRNSSLGRTLILLPLYEMQEPAMRSPRGLVLSTLLLTSPAFALIPTGPANKVAGGGSAAQDGLE